MRKNINKIVGLTLCIGMLTGCAQTPESSLVKPKGSKVENAYTETEGVDMVNEDSSENTKDKNTAVRTTIRDLLNAPETYKSQTTDDSAKLVVNTDATVEIPDVEKISAISVTPAEVTQDLLDRITDAFFSEAKLYTSDSYYTQTKDEIKKTLDELKEDVANGNLDPYNWGTDEDGNLYYNIYDDIEYWEEQYQSAPETKTLAEGRPVAGSQETENGTAENEFSGVAQMPDGSEYFYKTSSSGSDWSYALCNNLEKDNSLSNLGSGYAIYYTRTINGVPITQTMADGGALEDMDSTMETWSYESLYFFVDKDGIESMYYSNPYTIGETKTENLNLLPFSEIMKTYEKMMVVTNADNMEYEKSRVYDIDRIVLGYARIYEPSTDPHTGLLVPVWDFFGSRKVEGDYDGNSYSDITDYPNWSFLTINAVDGSIIDRDLGY